MAVKIHAELQFVIRALFCDSHDRQRDFNHNVRGTEMMKNKRDYTRGFTIVELLVVIVVIGILAAISIMAYNGIQVRAKDAVTQQDLANIDRKIQLYYTEHHDLPRSIAEMNQYGFPATEKMVWDTNSLGRAGSYAVYGDSFTDSTSSYLTFWVLYYSHTEGRWKETQWEWTNNEFTKTSRQSWCTNVNYQSCQTD